MKYYLWLKQAHGCDYTIACGETLIPLRASDRYSACKQVLGTLRELGWRATNSEIELEFATVIAVAEEYPADIGALLQEEHQSEREQAKQAEHVRDQAEFERLRRKLGR